MKLPTRRTSFTLAFALVASWIVQTVGARIVAPAAPVDLPADAVPAPAGEARQAA